MFLLRFLLKVVLFPIYILLMTVEIISDILGRVALFAAGFLILLFILCGAMSIYLHNYMGIPIMFMLSAAVVAACVLVTFAYGLFDLLVNMVGSFLRS